MPPSVDGFEIMDSVGSGGFSRVYRARQPGFDRDVALKVLGFGIESVAQRSTFERECRAMGVLSRHPNIVTVFSAAMTDDGHPCIAMEFYGAGTLGDRLDRDGPLPVAEVLAAGVEVAGALATVHARGVYHRDIKPQNLFVSDFGSVALGDFGISSFDDERSTTGTGALTVHYAPPELIEGESASAQSDVYSLAASLYALMSGERPYPRGPGQSVGDLARRILYEPVPRVDRPDVPDSLAELLHAAMAKRPDDRPASAAEFGTELQRVQLELGLAVTPMRLPDGPSVIEPTPITFAPPPPQVPLVGRRVTSAALGVLAVVAIGATAIAVTATDPPVSEAPTRPAAPAPAAGSDSFFAAPTTPSSITATRIDSTTVEVSWALSDRAVAYEVVPVGADAVSVPAPPVTLEADARPVCVIVRAIGDGGRLSADSDPVCSD